MKAVGPPSPILHTEPNGDIWVFGYGSLMWKPGFDVLERRSALILGYHRTFCVYSHWHRGSPEKPGLVMGLAPGGSCRGAAYRVAADNARAAVDYLDARERVTDVYNPRWVSAHTDNGTVTAITYVPGPRGHIQYAGKIDAAKAADLLAHGVGNSGPGWEYLENTVAHLIDEGIRDPYLIDLRDRVREIRR
ncbi:MAG: gamma-glutamylcyclotransferase [Rhodospirillaceae bacterium]|nr:gamma-glutamylcyclotransferase [Rhodospirillaceae bacterium]|tara:strand:+ start:3270 stop:3842 length:573 start_codon:yes stop_codon:yes gene_type:complete